MKPIEHSDDIQIGDDEWIAPVSVEGRYAEAIPVDELVSTLNPLWDCLWYYCFPDCCGLDAFDFSADKVRIALAVEDAPTPAMLRNFRSRLEAVDGDILESRKLNATLHKSTFLQLADHLIRCAPVPPN